MQYLPGGPEDDAISNVITPPSSPVVSTPGIEPTNDIVLDEADDEQIEF